jgi:hypothetical protein
MSVCAAIDIQLFHLRLSPEQSGKVEYERERLLGIANKCIHIRLFRFARGTTLIEMAVYECVLVHKNQNVTGSVEAGWLFSRERLAKW